MNNKRANGNGTSRFDFSITYVDLTYIKYEFQKTEKAFIIHTYLSFLPLYNVS